jgi:hypothetical protein
MTIKLLIGLSVLGGLALASRPAQAYPQWQFSSGTSRCNQCHFSPAGTGLITNYGRDAIGEELSSLEGDGGFLHGAVDMPSWLALGLDFRGMYLRHDNGSPDGTDARVFPMQADAYARFAFLDTFSLAITGGIRGRVRGKLLSFSSQPDDVPLGSNNFQSATAARFVSREHYLMWRSGALGPYVRAGRFFAPYGLRLAEHTTYIRKDLGQYLLQEGYGISAGAVQNEWEVHVTAFLPDILRQYGSTEKGLAAMYERRFNDAIALGLQGRAGFTDDAKRYGGGAFAKTWVPAIKTLLMGEVNLIHMAGNTGSGSNQMVAFLGPTVFPARGLWLSVFGEHSQTDIKSRNTATEAGNVQLNWFPYPHFEIVLQGRIQSPREQESAKTFFLQLHYFL